MEINVGIFVVSDDYDLNPRIFGTEYSTPTLLRINKVKDGYTVLFTVDDFMELNQITFLKTLRDTLNNNIAEGNFSYTLIYKYDELDREVVPEIAKMHDQMIIMENDSSRFRYNMKINKSFMNSLIEDYSLEDNIEEDDYEEDEEENDDEYEDEGYISSLLKDFNYDKDDDEEMEQYGSSEVLRNSNNVKRAIRRHGVIIANKEDIKDDLKIIKVFLKDFIPGNASWKKEFRNDVAKRWINNLAITKKDLKRLEKKHRKERNKMNKKSDGTRKALAMTYDLFTKPIDRWSDPNR